MASKATNISSTNKSFPTDLVTHSATKPFDQVVLDLERQLGHLDQTAALSNIDKMSDSVKQMEGTSGLMIIAMLQMDQLLPGFAKSGTRSRQYLIGNPLIADKMAKFDTLATLFAPPRVLLFTRDDQTCISYEQPSTTFGRLNSPEILEVANELDQKFEALAINALS
jgi:hypothetical protein